MLHHMATILVCYGGHFEPKMAAKIQKSSDFPVRFEFNIFFNLGYHGNGRFYEFASTP
jgi:hypothetical protein